MTSDVVELFLADHRRFEDLFRELRGRSSEVYPALRRYKGVDDEAVEHGAEEWRESSTSWCR